LFGGVVKQDPSTSSGNQESKRGNNSANQMKKKLSLSSSNFPIDFLSGAPCAKSKDLVTMQRPS
jgi:hypothetical protein